MRLSVLNADDGRRRCAGVASGRTSGNRIELLVIGKGARAGAAGLPGTILSRRPAGTGIPVPRTWLPPAFPSAPMEPSGHVGP